MLVSTVKWSESAISSVQFSRSVVSSSLLPYEPQHTRPPCLSPTLRACSNSCPSSWWCNLTISSSVVPFSSCPQSFPASGSFQMSQLFAWGGQSIGVSASTSVLPVDTQDWSPFCVHVSTPSWTFFPAPSHPSRSSRALPLLYCKFPLAIYFTRSSACMSILISQFIPPLLPQCLLVCFLHLCLYSCPSKRFITIFLDYTYMFQYMIFIFPFLTYLTL